MIRKLLLVVLLLASLHAEARNPRGSINGTSPPVTLTWTNVTPAGVDLTNNLDCSNFGTETVQADSSNPGALYTLFMCQGVWKSTDYGKTWAGPINTGTSGNVAGDCAGGLTVSPNATMGQPPTVYISCIRGGSQTCGSCSTSGNATGFWVSTDGGVNWTSYNIAPLTSSRQDVYQAVVDPCNSSHLLMNAHEQNFIVESQDGGHTWTNVPMDTGMLEPGGTGFTYFINTGSCTTTHTTWLWIAQQTGGTYGTWRTTNGGSSATWTMVSALEHAHGTNSMFQDAAGDVYIVGLYAVQGWGVLRSTDLGLTWTHVGNAGTQNVVWGSPNFLYSMYGWAQGLGTCNGANFQLGAAPGLGTWAQPSTPGGMCAGAAQVAVVFDGTNYIAINAAWWDGIWRYVE